MTPLNLILNLGLSYIYIINIILIKSIRGEIVKRGDDAVTLMSAIWTIL